MRRIRRHLGMNERLDKVRAWLEEFERCVNRVDYAGSAKLFYEGATVYGLYSDAKWISEINQKEWTREWPCIQNFAWTYGSRTSIWSEDQTQATAFLTFVSTGYDTYGKEFSRPGRATVLLLHRDGLLLCFHMHMSVEHGIQQDSFLCSRRSISVPKTGS